MLEEDPQEEKKSHPPKKMAQEKEEDLSFEFFGRRSKGRKRIFKPPGSPEFHSATATVCAHILHSIDPYCTQLNKSQKRHKIMLWSGLFREWESI